MSCNSPPFFGSTPIPYRTVPSRRISILCHHSLNFALRDRVIAWLEAGLKRDGSHPSRGAPSIGSVDPGSTSGSRVESVIGISNGTSQTGGPEDGNMLALLSQAIDQSGYEPVTGHTAPNGQRKRNLDVSPTFPGIVTPLKPNTIFEIAPAESWATTIDSSRARTLANILNETNDVDMSDVKPFELSGSDGMVGGHGEENPQADAEPVLWDLLWPGWNKNLPNPELMDHMYVSAPPSEMCCPLTLTVHVFRFQHRGLLPPRADGDEAVPLRHLQSEDGSTRYAQGLS